MKLLERLKLTILMLIHDERAAMGIYDVIIMAVSFFLVAILGPIAIDYISNATATGWDPAVKLIFKIVLPMLWVLAVALKYIPRGKGE